MVAIPLKVKVSVGRLSVYSGFQGTILCLHQQCIKEWHGSIWSGFLLGEFDIRFYCIDVVEEFVTYTIQPKAITSALHSKYIYTNNSDTSVTNNGVFKIFLRHINTKTPMV